jgi:hypothetical protein
MDEFERDFFDKYIMGDRNSVIGSGNNSKVVFSLSDMKEEDVKSYEGGYFLKDRDGKGTLIHKAFKIEGTFKFNKLIEGKITFTDTEYQ